MFDMESLKGAFLAVSMVGILGMVAFFGARGDYTIPKDGIVQARNGLKWTMMMVSILLPPLFTLIFDGNSASEFIVFGVVLLPLSFYFTYYVWSVKIEIDDNGITRRQWPLRSKSMVWSRMSNATYRHARDHFCVWQKNDHITWSRYLVGSVQLYFKVLEEINSNTGVHLEIDPAIEHVRRKHLGKVSATGQNRKQTGE